MDDPWAAWGSKSKAAMSMSPPREELDVSDPWAKPQAASTSTTPEPQPSTSPSSPTAAPPSPPSTSTLGALPPSPKLKLGAGGWGDELPSWGGPAAETKLPGEGKLELKARSPSPALDDGWGAPSASTSALGPELGRVPSASGRSSPTKTHSPLARVSMEAGVSRRSTELPRMSMEADVFSRSSSSRELPRVSMEAEAFSRPASVDIGRERVSEEAEAFSRSPSRTSARPSLDVGARQPSMERTRSTESPRASVDRKSLDLARGGFGSPGPPLEHESLDVTTGGFGFGDTSMENALAPPADLSLRRSPSFGSDFGDFGGFSAQPAAADPWGAGTAAENSSWEKPEDNWAKEEWKEESWKAEEPAEPVEDSGWGGARSRTPPPQKTSQEEEWEAEQRRIAVADARAPFHVVNTLKKEWDGVATEVIGEGGLEMSEEQERSLEDGTRVLEENVRETMRSLTTPPETTFSFASSATQQRYANALTRVNPNPSASLLRTSIRSRRQDGLDFGPGLEGAWDGRSRLGEPEAAAQQAAVQEDPGSSKWSFWRRNTTPKPLITSGGGVLEIKSATAEAAGPSLESPKSITDTASIAPSVVSVAPSTSASISSVNTVAPSSVPAPNTAAPRLSTGSPAPSISSRPGTPDVREEPAQPQPSRTSRFWGRFGRKGSTPVSAGEVEAASKEDLELSADDFAFLAEVPSIPQQGTGDLLGMDGPMSSLDAVLGPSAPAPAPLPAPLAPPPAPAARPSSGFAARMVQPQRKASDVDLLAGLDFDEPADLSTASGSQSAAPASSSMWDDFLVPSSQAPRSSTPSTPPPPILPPPTTGRSSPPIVPQAVPRLTPAPRSGSPAPRMSSPLAGPSVSALSNGSAASSRQMSMGLEALSPSAPPPRSSSSSNLGGLDNFGMLAPAPAQRPGSTGPSQPRPPSMFGDLDSFSSLTPTPPRRGSGNISSPLNPTPTERSSTPLMTPQRPTAMTTMAPSAPSAPSMPASASLQPAAKSDDFGDFGDFGDFSTSSTTATPAHTFGNFSTPTPASDFDDFGDFSSFATLSPAPPTPIAKSPVPAPVSKSPSKSPSTSPDKLSLVPTQELGRSTSRSPPGRPPVFARPAGLPQGLRNGPSAYSPPSNSHGSSTSRRTPSVDHRATLSLMSAVKFSELAEGDGGPISPVPPPLAPPPGGLFAFPPPPGGVRKRGGEVGDLMD